MKKVDWFNSVPMRTWHWILLGLITWFSFHVVFGVDTYEEEYSLILKCMMVALYCLIAAGLVIAGTGKAKARSLRFFVGFVSLLVAAISAYLLFGLAQYVLGVNCDSFFGVRDAESCVQIRMMFASLLLLPSIFIPAALVLMAGLVKGLIDQRDETGRLF